MLTSYYRVSNTSEPPPGRKKAERPHAQTFVLQPSGFSIQPSPLLPALPQCYRTPDRKKRQCSRGLLPGCYRVTAQTVPAPGGKKSGTLSRPDGLFSLQPSALALARAINVNQAKSR